MTLGSLLWHQTVLLLPLKTVTVSFPPNDVQFKLSHCCVTDVVVSFTAIMYNTSESVGYVTMCAKIIVGALGRSIDVYLSTMNGTAAAGRTNMKCLASCII